MIYEYKLQGNLLYSLGLLISAIICVLGGSLLEQPIFIYMPLGFLWLFGAWYFMSNPSHGCTLTVQDFSYWSGKQSQSFKIEEIGSVGALQNDEEDFELILKNGQRKIVPSLCLGSHEEFLSAVTSLGVTAAR